MEFEGQFLILKRSENSPQGGLWTAAPGGKLELRETPLEAAIREIHEETGIARTNKQLTFIQTFYCRFPDIEYALHLFYSRLDEKPDVVIDPREHSDYAWKTLEETIELPIMRGGDTCIRFVKDWIARET